MKKYIAFLLVIAAITLHSQDFEPSSSTFTYVSESSTFSTYLSADSSWFRQNRFMLEVH